MEGQKVIKVFIVDDHQLIRAGIKKILAKYDNIVIAGEAASGAEAIALLKNVSTDLVLMDLKMPGQDGLATTKQLLAGAPYLKILVLSAFSDDGTVLHFLKAGAKGFLSKDCGEIELIHAIKAIYANKNYLPPPVSSQLSLYKLGKSPHLMTENLSEREFEVMLRIVKGKKTAAIAKEFGLETKTVNSYRYRIYEKLDIHNNVDLTLACIRQGLLDISEV